MSGESRDAGQDASAGLDRELLELLPRLSNFVADVDALLSGKDDGGATLEEILGTADSPLDIALRIKIEAVHLYHGVLRLTEDPLAAPAAPVLVRSLVECWAHALWIAEGVPGADSTASSAEERATCLELGMAQWFVDNLGKSSPESQAATALEDATKWLEEVGQTRAEFACTCNGRDFRSVQPTLRYLKDQFQMPWALDTWIASSAAGHVLMPHRLARRVGDHVVWGGPATVAGRMTWLNRGTVCLFNVFLYVIGTIDRSKVQAYLDLANPPFAALRELHNRIGSETPPPVSEG